MIESLSIYIPLDRYLALTQGNSLANHCFGSALFADISGFTPLTEALVKQHGDQRAAEEITHHLNRVYESLITQVHKHRGSIIGFVGDAITCWFEGDDGLQAIACGLALQATMQPINQITLAEGEIITMAIKIGIANGNAQRLVIGDPQIQYLDVLVGQPLYQMAQAEQLADKDEVVVAPSLWQIHKNKLEIIAHRTNAKTKQRFAVVSKLTTSPTFKIWSRPKKVTVSKKVIRPWLLPAIYQRLQWGQGDFLAELRMAVSLFLKFEGLDYDNDSDVGQKLDDYIRWVQQTVTHYGGNLIQLTIGDKGSFLYAVFGAPIAHDDDAERAVATALVLQQAPSPLAYITAQIGITKGQARVGAYGGQSRRTYGVIGNEAILAARLMGIAPAGQIRVAHTIYQATQDKFAFNVLAPVHVKGRASSIQVYEPVGKLKDTKKNTAKHPEDIIGREDEINYLQEHLTKVKAGGHRVLFIEGEPGIGKTRLIEELEQLLHKDGLTGLFSTGQSIEQQTPYYAWQHIFNTFFGLTDITDLKEKQTIVTQHIQEINPTWLTRLPLLNDILDLQLPETSITQSLERDLRQKSLHDLLVGLLRAWSANQPLIIILDDTQWLSSLSWVLALQIAQRLPISNSAFLFVIVSRPLEEYARVKRWTDPLQKLDYTYVLSLKTILPEKTVALAALRLGVPVENIPPSLAEIIIGRAGGHPFFAEQLALMLLQQGAIKIEVNNNNLPPDCYLTPPFNTIVENLPDTIQGSILTRIDRLEVTKQTILKVSSIIGRIFSFTILRDILAPYITIPDLGLKVHLQELDSFGLTPLETPEPYLQYRFKHSLIQEVMYETMLFRQRKAIHKQLGVWYEYYYASCTKDNIDDINQTVTSDTAEKHLIHYTPANIFPLLVYHYHYATDKTKEQYYAQQAGKQAMARFANTEALTFFNRAIELTDVNDYKTQYEILLNQEEVHHLQGDRKAQTQDITALKHLIDFNLDQSQQLTISIRQMRYMYYTANYQAGIEIGQQALRLAKDTSDAVKQAEMCMWLGWCFKSLGNYLQANTWLKQAQKLAPEQSFILMKILRSLGSVAIEQVNYSIAKTYFQQSQKLASELGNLKIESDNLTSLGALCGELGDIKKALVYFEQALPLTQQIGYRYREGLVWLNWGAILDNQGNYSQAIVCFENALQISRDIQSNAAEIFSLINLSGSHLELGYYEQAHAYINQALNLARKIKFARAKAVALGYLTLTWYFTGNYALAKKCANEALQVIANTKSVRDKSLILINFGTVLTAQGEYQKAIDCFEEALHLQDATSQDYLMFKLLAGLAEANLAQNKILKALDYVERILDHLQKHPLDKIYLKSPAYIFWVCYQVLVANQDSRAKEILHLGYTLFQKNRQLLIEADRHAFLNLVAINRAFVAEYKKLAATQS